MAYLFFIFSLFLDCTPDNFVITPRADFGGPWTRTNSMDSATNKKNYHFDNNGFEAFVDVHLFEPNEIFVKTVDHTIVIECNHEEKEDGHGSVLRNFTRKFQLPSDYDMNTVKSTLSTDGILTLKVPKPANKIERHVEVEQTEKPSFLMSLFGHRAHWMLKHPQHSEAEEFDEEIPTKE